MRRRGDGMIVLLIVIVLVLMLGLIVSVSRRAAETKPGTKQVELPTAQGSSDCKVEIIGMSDNGWAVYRITVKGKEAYFASKDEYQNSQTVPLTTLSMP